MSIAPVIIAWPSPEVLPDLLRLLIQSIKTVSFPRFFDFVTFVSTLAPDLPAACLRTGVCDIALDSKSLEPYGVKSLLCNPYYQQRVATVCTALNLCGARDVQGVGLIRACGSRRPGENQRVLTSSRGYTPGEPVHASLEFQIFQITYETVTNKPCISR